MSGVVVVGAGQAGASCVARLRTKGYQGAITLIGDEPVPPYQRPPLSKAYLLGDLPLDRLFLRPESYYADQDISLRTGETVTNIDPVARTVTTQSGAVPYDDLVLATGAAPRHLPDAIGGSLEGVFCVRTLADVDAMASHFVDGARVLIVGGGYIGLEAAAVAAKLGVHVTLLEAAPRILQRVAAEQTSEYFRAAHAAQGVTLCEGVGLSRLIGDTSVKQAELTDGAVLDVDFVIVGVGVTPAQHLAEIAGVKVDNGIAVDSLGRTSDRHIWAAGDCASFPGPKARIRLESVGNAIDMGELVADNILGEDRAYIARPWFWSDQYDIKLQIAGLSTGFDHVVSRGSGASVSFWYYAKGQLIALDAMNDPRAYMVGKRLIEAGKSPDPVLLADPATNLKTLLKG
jgi:3-phenylpropionate/trans-cinnamate dioxygenase ferredoxin reductase subunit